MNLSGVLDGTTDYLARCESRRTNINGELFKEQRPSKEKTAKFLAMLVLEAIPCGLNPHLCGYDNRAFMIS